MIAIIAAMDRKRVIGQQNQLPWNLPEDLKHFKEVTMGHPIIMGRKTFQSIGRPLPGRENVVLTRDDTFQAEGITIVNSLTEALDRYKDQDPFVIGGADVFQRSIPLSHTIYLTLIDQEFEGDAYFPELDLEHEFEVVEESERFVSDKEGIPYRFVTLKRRTV